MINQEEREVLLSILDDLSFNYGKSDKFFEDLIAKLTPKQPKTDMLSEETRKKLKTILLDSHLGSGFGDHQEEEYILDGCNMVGLNNMSDAELIEEYAQYQDDDDEFLLKLQCEMEAHKMLTKREPSTWDTPIDDIIRAAERERK